MLETEINGYQMIEKVDSLNDNIAIWICEKDNARYELLKIKRNEKYSRMLDRLMRDEVRPLADLNISGIQNVRGYGWNEDKTEAYIVYESIEDYCALEKDNSNARMSALKDILTALDELKKKNKQVHAISPKYIFVNDAGNAKLAFVGLFELFKQQNLLEEEYLPSNVIEYLRGVEYRPGFQDDIYSAIKSFEPLLRMQDDESAAKILEKALAEKREERFSKYPNILELAEKIAEKIYDRPKRSKILKIGMSPGKREEFLPVIEEMNIECYMRIESERAQGEDDIMGRFSTSGWSGRFFVKDDYIRIGSHRSVAQENIDTVGDSWFLADFAFSFDDYSTTFKAYTFFKNKFVKQNQLAKLTKTKKESVGKWRILPEKEREYIEGNAFRVRYSRVEFPKENDVTFFIGGSYQNWEKIKALKSEGVILCLNDKKIGKIGDLHQKDGVITIKDILCDKDEITKQGELFEDVRQKVSQYKKQVEACQKFMTRDVVNPDICAILATPGEAKMPDCDPIRDEYDKFADKVFNKNLEDDDTQREAVLEALSYKPLYLIQGPPGTGKTTVIVELIRQIVEGNKDVRILVTSQSNLAVDNVLERLEEVNQKENQNLRFMRLASESEDKGLNVIESIKPHTYEEKLKHWVSKTIKKSKATLDAMLPEGDKKKHIVNLYDSCRNISFDEFKKKLVGRMNYVKNLFEDAKSMDDVKKIFDKELGDKFLKFRQIHKDWMAFLSNVTNKEKQSTLSSGSGQLDFLTAMLMYMNIIGATCIHIASAKYSKVNFRFDYVIMDESSKASPAETLVPVNMGKSIILIGDHKQLPPVVTREEAVKQKVKKELEDNGLDVEKEFGESLFEILIKAFEEDEDKQRYVKMLDIQYRMPKQVGSLISKYFYNDKLNNPDESVIPDYDKKKHHGLKLKKDTSIIFVSTSDRDNCNDNNNKYKRENACNRDVIKAILEKLNELYAGNSKVESPHTIGIIAGYRGQVELLKRTVDLSQYQNFVITKDDGTKTDLIEINTVDKFQGAERDIIIYDIVRSAPGIANIGFLDDYRRINVAFSRVKRLLIVVGDSEYLIKRAKGRFEEFELQEIAKELQEQGLVFNSLNLEEVF